MSREEIDNINYWINETIIESIKQHPNRALIIYYNDKIQDILNDNIVEGDE